MNLDGWVALFKEYEKVYGQQGVDLSTISVNFEFDGLSLTASERLELKDQVCFFLDGANASD